MPAKAMSGFTVEFSVVTYSSIRTPTRSQFEDQFLDCTSPVIDPELYPIVEEHLRRRVADSARRGPIARGYHSRAGNQSARPYADFGRGRAGMGVSVATLNRRLQAEGVRWRDLARRPGGCMRRHGFSGIASAMSPKSHSRWALRKVPALCAGSAAISAPLPAVPPGRRRSRYAGFASAQDEGYHRIAEPRAESAVAACGSRRRTGGHRCAGRSSAWRWQGAGTAACHTSLPVWMSSARRRAVEAGADEHQAAARHDRPALVGRPPRRRRQVMPLESLMRPKGTCQRVLAGLHVDGGEAAPGRRIARRTRAATVGASRSVT